MTKVAAKNSIILIGGYNLSTYATAYETQTNSNPIDVTGFTDGCKNFIPGLPSAVILTDVLWSSTAGAVHTALHDFASANVTILPEGYALGNLSISLPYVQANYQPKGQPDSAISVGTINFVSRGDNEGVEHGKVLAHATITNTATGTGYQVNSDAVTSACAATLHIWSLCAADTYVVKVQHCATVDGVYADLMTFTANGSALISERQTAASGTINKFIRVLATRTGSAGNSFGYTVHYWQTTIG
jgi:hypothetical protein